MGTEGGDRVGKVARRALGTMVLALVLLSGATGEAWAQSLCGQERWLALSPALLHDGDGETAPGVGLSLGSCWNEYDTGPAFARATYLAATVEAQVPFRDLRIPQNIEASVQAGLSACLCRRRPIDLEADPDLDLYDFHLGFLGAGLRLQHEASADLGERAIAGGAELRWVDPARSYLPSTVLTFAAVRPTASEVRSELELGRDWHSRMDLRVYWLVPLGSALHVELDAGTFRAWGLDEPLETLGLDGGTHGTVTLGYAWSRTLGPVALRGLFVGYAAGERATAPEGGDRAWTLGLELGRRGPGAP